MSEPKFRSGHLVRTATGTLRVVVHTCSALGVGLSEEDDEGDIPF